ncbi:MAG: hypothetical protein H6R14_2326 [Proteobacteria bacterium]|nr:hypothetical protein [Pseudomonadota bacterium]
MSLNRKFLIPIWLVLSLVAYYLFLMTQLGNYYHGGNAIGKSIEDAIGVLAVFASLEIFRTERSRLARIAAVLMATPLVMVLSLELWFGIKWYLS